MWQVLFGVAIIVNSLALEWYYFTSFWAMIKRPGESFVMRILLSMTLIMSLIFSTGLVAFGVYLLIMEPEHQQATTVSMPPKHFRMIVDRKTVDGFIGTNIDGSRYVTTRFTIDSKDRSLVAPGDTLDTWFNGRMIQLKTPGGLPIHYTQLEVLHVRYDPVQ